MPLKYLIHRLLLFSFVLLSFPVLAQTDNSPEEDTTQILLLEDISIQIEATQAINDMYNFQFEKAEMQFRWIKQKYPHHPLAFFLLALSEWWKISVNIDNTQYDEEFEAYLDTAIFKAEILYSISQFKIESAFFQAAGWAFKGRLYAERKKWGQAANAARQSLKYLDVINNKGYLSPELLFGDGLYNYFVVWIRENYPMLKPIMAFFKKGDKELGLKQLRTVATNAFYTRTEAQYYLMRILSYEEKDMAGALQISEYLHKTFPQNSYFHRYFARMLYSTGQFRKAERVSLSILERIDSGQTGYEQISGRYAAFYLGQIYEQRRDFEKSKFYYTTAIEFAKEIGATDTGYYLYSLIALGEIAINEGNKELAEEYFKEVRKDSKRKHPANKRSRELLKEL
jgi:tetratricopeptide (TPR) repeat protein